MNINPEFRRNLILEWSSHRALLVGIVIASIFTTVKLFAPGNVIAQLALLIFVITTLAWGSRQASDALLDELRDHTWDTQRMSALGPWAMCWGKLFGATIIPWFSGAICLAVYVIERDGLTVTERLQVVLACVAAAMMLHALSLLAALSGTWRRQPGRGLAYGWMSILVLAFASVTFSRYFGRTDSIAWFGARFTAPQFLSGSVGAFAVWSVFGAYRQMCMELAVATKPWAWLGFIWFVGIYCAGFYRHPHERLMVFMSASLVTSLCGAYVCAFLLHRDPISFRRLAVYVRGGHWSRALNGLPVWFVSLCAAIAFALANAFFIRPGFGSSAAFSVNGLVGVSLVLICLRDLAVLFYFTFGRDLKRVETTTVITIATGFWLLPRALESAGFPALGWLLQPPISEKELFSVVVLGVHVLVAGSLCLWRYRVHVAPR